MSVWYGKREKEISCRAFLVSARMLAVSLNNNGGSVNGVLAWVSRSSDGEMVFSGKLVDLPFLKLNAKAILSKEGGEVTVIEAGSCIRIPISMGPQKMELC
ncbi:MAG TPA: hypothetical protein ENI16_00055 [Candidatus Portnoybacteria bacterium]|nr:hypothetical protein [Candidatus Portnoybacteria bacterium]